jgi:DNA replication protein DnaC
MYIDSSYPVNHRSSTAAALVSELIEARDEKRLLRFQKQMASYELLIVDELGFVPLSKTGAELLFELLSQRRNSPAGRTPTSRLTTNAAAWLRTRSFTTTPPSSRGCSERVKRRGASRRWNSSRRPHPWHGATFT